jgi:hypothetical protein
MYISRKSRDRQREIEYASPLTPRTRSSSLPPCFPAPLPRNPNSNSPELEFFATYSNHNTSLFSNRNKYGLSESVRPNSSAELPASSFQILIVRPAIRNHRKPPFFNHLNFSNRRKTRLLRFTFQARRSPLRPCLPASLLPCCRASLSRNPNRNTPELEFLATHSNGSTLHFLIATQTHFSLNRPFPAPSPPPLSHCLLASLPPCLPPSLAPCYLPRVSRNACVYNSRPRPPHG